MIDDNNFYEDAFDDDVPWASPEIKIGYEAALGRFILEFNRIDNLLTKLIDTVLGRLDRNDLSNQCRRDFSQKLFSIELLRMSPEGEGLKHVPVQDLKTIAGQRNHLAHGHFDQNPYDGTYDVVTKSTRSQYSVEKINSLTELANKAWDKLRSAEAYYMFADIVIVSQATKVH